MGLRSDFGLGLDQPIPPAAFRDVLPPPPGLPSPSPKLQTDFFRIALLCFVFGFVVDLVSEGIEAASGTARPSVPWWTVVLSILFYGVGVFLIVLAWVRWSMQKQAIRDGEQVVATVIAFRQARSGPTGLDATWVGNDEKTYYFTNMARLNVGVGEEVRLYISRSDTRVYYLDDLALPYQQPPEQPGATYPPSAPAMPQPAVPPGQPDTVSVVDEYAQAGDVTEIPVTSAAASQPVRSDSPTSNSPAPVKVRPRKSWWRSWGQDVAECLLVAVALILANVVLVSTAIRTEGTITSITPGGGRYCGGTWDYTISYSVDGTPYASWDNCVATDFSQNPTVPVLVRPSDHASATLPNGIFTYPWRASGIVIILWFVVMLIIFARQTLGKTHKSPGTPSQSPPGPPWQAFRKFTSFVGVSFGYVVCVCMLFEIVSHFV